MATFIVLMNFTDQGIRNIADSPKRTEAAKAIAQKLGITIRETFWTLGRYDVVAICEAPDATTATSFGLSIGKLGNVRTETLPAFSQAEMSAILGKIA